MEFERLIKKNARPATGDYLPVRVLIECFRDHWAFLDIVHPETLTQELMFDEIFLKPLKKNEKDVKLLDRECAIPSLMLLGILYCRSNRK